MKYANKQAMDKAIRKYSPLDTKDKEGWWLYRDLGNKSLRNWRMGDFLLFQHIKGKEISRPIYGCIAGFNLWDQALVLHFIESARAIHRSTKNEILVNLERNYYCSWDELDPETEPIQFWTDEIKVWGHWSQRPSISELKKAYESNTH